MHSCRAYWCDSPHGEHELECLCELCHDAHIEDGPQLSAAYCGKCHSIVEDLLGQEFCPTHRTPYVDSTGLCEACDEEINNRGC